MDGYRLSAVVGQTDPSGRFHARVAVRATGSPPLSGPVTFHKQPTFTPSTETVQASDGIAQIELRAYGPSTVGAVVPRSGAPEVRLELDLGDVPRTEEPPSPEPPEPSPSNPAPNRTSRPSRRQKK